MISAEQQHLDDVMRVIVRFTLVHYFAQRQLKQYIESREDIRTDITIATLEFALAMRMAQRLIPERCYQPRRDTEPLVDFTYTNIIESELVPV